MAPNDATLLGRRARICWLSENRGIHLVSGLSKMHQRPSRGINLVLRGGGVKGIAIVGALEALEQGNVYVEQVGGASAGALIAALHAAGHSPYPILFDERSEGRNV